MAITYTWNKKKLVADFFGMVSQIKFERKGVDGSYTDTAIAILVIPEDDEEHADKWTESRVDALAETHKAALDEEVAKRIQRLKDEAAGQKDDATIAKEQKEKSKALEKEKGL
jgi:hypothetical protein|tara:strand:- start:50 stop:388 length:339 start_codon:yes stop_codon:yes gene_type:complete